MIGRTIEGGAKREGGQMNRPTFGKWGHMPLAPTRFRRPTSSNT